VQDEARHHALHHHWGQPRQNGQLAQRARAHQRGLQQQQQQQRRPAVARVFGTTSESSRFAQKVQLTSAVDDGTATIMLMRLTMFLCSQDCR
jgi:hypothetical protein